MLQFFNLFKVPAFSIAWLAVNFAWAGCAAHFMPGKTSAIYMILVATWVFWGIAVNVPRPSAKKGAPAPPVAAAPPAPDFQKDLLECAEGTLTIDEFCERWKGAVPPKTGYHRPIFSDTKFKERAASITENPPFRRITTGKLSEFKVPSVDHRSPGVAMFYLGEAVWIKSASETAWVLETGGGYVKVSRCRNGLTSIFREEDLAKISGFPLVDRFWRMSIVGPPEPPK